MPLLDRVAIGTVVQGLRSGLVYTDLNSHLPLERENARLKRIVGEQALDLDMLMDHAACQILLRSSRACSVDAVRFATRRSFNVFWATFFSLRLGFFAPVMR
jgi:hypothetical protein